jgi:hypothetical protein
MVEDVESKRMHGPADRLAISGAVYATKRRQSKKREPKESGSPKREEPDPEHNTGTTESRTAAR